MSPKPDQDVMEEDVEVDGQPDIALDINRAEEPFYLRYYAGHQGRFGHEFLEFDFRLQGDGQSASLRYANNSKYRNDSLIKKEARVSPAVVAELKRIIAESEILK